jgi:hypothetical protein
VYGASVMISSHQGVLGKLEREINSKLISTHCPALLIDSSASKAAQKEILDFVENLVSDMVFYVLQRQFNQKISISEPLCSYRPRALLQYHKIQWLSLTDCVNRLCFSTKIGAIF